MAKRDPKRRAALKDFHLWTEVTETVSPLRRRPLLETAGDGPLPLPRAPVPAMASPPIFPDYAPVPQAPVPPKRPDIEPKMRRRLRRGQIEIDGTLDLHGKRQDEARSSLRRYLNARYDRGDRTILVITGKGLKKLDPEGTQIVERGVLRSMLPVWLSEPGLAEIVAGWDSASQPHGGEGAFYVRLKRPRP
jgi:DNA-nicking Smr family endonuclease